MKMGLERAIAELNAISDGVFPSGLTELVDLKMLCNELMDSLKGAKALVDSEIAVQIAEFEGNTQTLADGRKVRLSYQKRRREVDREGIIDFVEGHAKFLATEKDLPEAEVRYDMLHEFFRPEPRWGAMIKKLGLEDTEYCVSEEVAVISITT
tara:strand:- start:251 stop:709 length:459 start_codon:yes stop_codon:yes gene_type:complete